MKIKIIIFCIAIIGGFALGRYFAPSQIEEKTVTKTKYRDRVRTIIKERPDGTKVTIIDKKSEGQKTDKKQITKPIKKDWLVGISAGPSGLGFEDPIWMLRAERRVLLDFYAGLYARTDGEVGVSLSYNF